jgi:hypothetical protein
MAVSCGEMLIFSLTALSCERTLSPRRMASPLVGLERQESIFMVVDGNEITEHLGQFYRLDRDHFPASPLSSVFPLARAKPSRSSSVSAG